MHTEPKEKRDPLYEDLKQLNDKAIDLFLIGAIRFRNAIARGEGLHFFEKKIAEIEDIIIKIKAERLLKSEGKTHSSLF